MSDPELENEHSGAAAIEDAARRPVTPVPAHGESLEVLINKTPFRIVFKGTQSTRTTSVPHTVLVSKGTGLYDVQLKTLRERGKLPSAYSFCVDDANTVTDDTKLGDFITLSESNVTALKTAKSDSVVVLTANYTSKHRRPVNVVAPPTLPTVKLDDDSKRAEVEKKVADLLKIDTSGMLAGDGSVVSSHPAELSGHDWNYLMVTNSLLYGFYFDKATGTLQRARFPAFKLKRSFVDRFQRPAASNTTRNDQNHSDPKIPPFEVTDDSSVTITEIKTSLQHSMAKHAFSSTSVEASLSGGIGSFSASASASYDSSSSSSSASNVASSMDCLHASYNFPRVTVFLDSDDLVILDDCKNLLEKIRQSGSPADVATFHKKYGHIFTRCVQLGGRLHATRDSSAFSDAKASTKKDSLKVAAGLSFSSMYVSGSVSASHGNTGDEARNRSTNTSSSSLTWEAQGGETTLSTNAPAWIKTVGSFYNWRVMQRSDVCDILTIMNDLLPGVDWRTLVGNIGSPSSIDYVPLSFVATSPSSAHAIITKNDSCMPVLVSIFRDNKFVDFSPISPRSSITQGGDTKESIFITRVTGGRIAMALAGPGTYSLRNVIYMDHSVEYVSNGKKGVIHLANHLEDTIRVRLGDHPSFDDILPNKFKTWKTTHMEPIFIKFPSSNALSVYLGVPNRDLVVKAQSKAFTPNLTDVDGAAASNIGVENKLGSAIDVRITSSSKHDEPSELRRIEPGARLDLARRGPEVIYVSGLGGTVVGAYYGTPSKTLVVNEEMC